MLQRLLRDLEDLGSAPREAQRMEWLCERVRLKHAKRKSQKDVIRYSKSCCKALHANLQLLKDFRSGSEERVETNVHLREWERAQAFCTEMERLHTTLDTFWTCNCTNSHAMAKFSYDLPCSPDTGVLNCRLFFPRQIAQDGYTIWQAAKLQFERRQQEVPDSNPQILVETEGPQLFTAGAEGTTQAGSNEGVPGGQISLRGLCRSLDAAHEGTTVRLVQSETSLSMPTASFDEGVQSGVFVNDPIPLNDWLQGSQPCTFKSVPRKERLILALILSYAYLHLGGGPWWPYDRLSNSVWFFNTAGNSMPDVRKPFIASSLQQRAEPPGDELWFLENYNNEMLSLPLFGKLLLELRAGRRLEWFELPKVMNKYRDKELGHEIVGAAQACLGRKDDTFRSSENESIRKTERMRMEFVSKVVLKLQYVLAVGFHVKIDEIFREMATPMTLDTEHPPQLHAEPLPFLSETSWCLHDDNNRPESLNQDEYVKQPQYH